MSDFTRFGGKRVLEAVITLLLTIHLSAMNVASIGPLVGAWFQQWSVRGPGSGAAGFADAARRIFAWSLTALALGAVVGGAMLLSPSPGMQAALKRFPADAYWFAGSEIVFSALCIAGCWRLRNWPKTTWLLSIATASNLLYHFPPLMSVLGELAADPQWTEQEVLDRDTLLGLWRRPEVLSLWLHFVLASIAVGSVVSLVAYERSVARSAPEPSEDDGGLLGDHVTRRLAGAALAATLLQIPVGLWLLLSSDDGAQQSMMGGDWLATIGLAGGVWVALGVMQSLASLTWGGSDRRQLFRACCLLLLTILLMSMTLRSSRQAGVPALPRAPASLQ
jgi:hypothetical protein